MATRRVAKAESKKSKPKAQRRKIPVAQPLGAALVRPLAAAARVAFEGVRAVTVLEGRELARGQGGQESLSDVRFVDDTRVVAVGRDVNSGPALLELPLET